MFSFDETPFRTSEVHHILGLDEEEFVEAQEEIRLSRNILCHFRNDDSFNFSNFFDILSFCLERFEYDRIAAEEEPTDVISGFIDRISCALEMGRRNSVEEVGEVVFRVAHAIKIDLFGRELREFSQFGEYLLNSNLQVIRVDQRENFFCAIVVALLHRAMKVFHASSISRATPEQVLLVDQTVAVCQGKLCSYFPEAMLSVREDQRHTGITD